MSGRFRPSPAMVVASVALFVAVGGISWAAATIGTNDIENGAVTKKKLSGDQRTLWAAVKSNGTVAGQSGGITVKDLGQGSYVVNFHKKVSGRALVASGVNGKVIADATLCNGGSGVGSDCSGDAPNDKRHVGVNTALATVDPTIYTNLPFYVAALPK
jgi:hypothetical protein